MHSNSQIISQKCEKEPVQPLSGGNGSRRAPSPRTLITHRGFAALGAAGHPKEFSVPLTGHSAPHLRGFQSCSVPPELEIRIGLEVSPQEPHKPAPHPCSYSTWAGVTAWPWRAAPEPSQRAEDGEFLGLDDSIPSEIQPG